ncbi:hypothetical protein M2145_001505 [Lachnospiraceae bacterium PF1-21]
MAVLKNKTQTNFTMISNNVLRDKGLSMKDRGVLCTLCSLPDGWNFSIAGLSTLVPDGVDSIRKAIINLETVGYINRTKTRGENGKYVSEIEVFTERKSMTDLPLWKNHHGKPVVDNPRRTNSLGITVTENTAQYNTDNRKLNNEEVNNKSIYQSKEQSLEQASEIEGEINALKKQIAENINLDNLILVAENKNCTEVEMVNQIYDAICDMVCYPREKVVIKKTSYSWETVKNQFLKLRYQHVADILNRIVDADLGIKNMSAYLNSALYTASLVGTIERQASLHDDYLKFLRGRPYLT